MVLDKNITKYVTMIDSNIVSGQDGKTGIWYCKELPAKTVEETDTKIGQLNKIYNRYNKEQMKNEKK